VLSVGVYGPHRGFGEAFEVAANLAERGLPHRLRLVGEVPRHAESVVHELRVASGHPGRIELLGRVDALVPLLHRASALIVTSRYEGFGLPALEAMATGLPVVAFANSAIREVVGDGGILVADGDVEAMADALAGLVSDDDLWAEMSQRAMDRAAVFSWSACVEAHVTAYEAALG
jgi:alpha-1,3-rhamnosyl/mannosyltransferase